MPRAKWTHEEIAELKQKLEGSLHATEEEHPDIKPLPPMDEEEAKNMLYVLFRAAAERLLSESESLLLGQLLAAYRMAVEARMLGRKGRYFVVSEEEIRLMQGDSE
jgi:hypothetical protein